MSKSSPSSRELPSPPAIPVEVPLPEPQSLIIELVEVDQEVLAECNEGQQVKVRGDQNPVIVTTLTGIRVGHAKPDDAAKLTHKKSKQGRIVTIDVASGRCFVEVL